MVEEAPVAEELVVEEEQALALDPTAEPEVVLESKIEPSSELAPELGPVEPEPSAPSAEEAESEEPLLDEK